MDGEGNREPISLARGRVQGQLELLPKPVQGVFSYHVLPCVELPADTEGLWTWHCRRYLLCAVEVNEYQQHMRVHSPKWGAVTLPRAAYRELEQPLHHYTRVEAPVPPGAASFREDALG